MQNNANFANILAQQNLVASFGSENIGTASRDWKEQTTSENKRPHHRHTVEQIQKLEAFFEECPNPNAKQRKELGRALGMDPKQIKYWFQNKQTYTKNLQKKGANQELRAENDKLRAEIMRLKETLHSATCQNCGGPATTRDMPFEKIDNILVSKASVSQPQINAQTQTTSGSLIDQDGARNEMLAPVAQLKTIVGTSETVARTSDKKLMLEHAFGAMQELLKMAETGEPLWRPIYDSSDVLNLDEYLREFPIGVGSRALEWRTEATRETTMMMINPINLVQMLMDVNQWFAMFSSMVCKATRLKVLATGDAGDYNGCLQVVLAAYQVLSPVVPLRQNSFLRYCRQQEDGTWAVVDVSLGSLKPNSSTMYRRCPSGCVIKEMPNGYSKVIWVEHVEVDDRSINGIYEHVINSGLAFGAKRWISTLNRQLERFGFTMDHNFPSGTTSQIWRSLPKLAERMVESFCTGVTGSCIHNWSLISDVSKGDLKVTSSNYTNDPGRPIGLVINGATSLWLPVIPRRLFDFLRNGASRSKWDFLTKNHNTREVFTIFTGPDQGNCISLLRCHDYDDNFILQESSFSTTGSYVVYASLDLAAMNVVRSGGDINYVPLLPSGFVILPDGLSSIQGGDIWEMRTEGSLLTVAFQILDDLAQDTESYHHSIETIKQIIISTIDKIKAAI